MFIDQAKREVYPSTMSNEPTPFQRRFDAAMEYAGAPGNRAAFGAMLGLGANQNQKLYNWYKRDQSIPDAQRKPLAAIGISIDWINTGEGEMIVSSPVSQPATTEGYVRFDLFEGAAGMGAGVANADYPEVIRTVSVAEWEIRRKLGFLPAPGRMKLMTGRGPSMRPKIEDGDVVMIDTWCTYFDGDDYYLINVDGDAQIKKLMKRTDGLWVVSSNPEFPEWRIDPQDLTVCGKALIGMGLRRL